MTPTGIFGTDLSRLSRDEVVNKAVSGYHGGNSAVMFTPGRAIEKNTSGLVSLAVVVLEPTKEQSKQIHEYLYSFQRLTQRCRIVMITDSDDLKSVRPFGWMVEHVHAQVTYEALELETPWKVYLHERISNALNLLDIEVVHFARASPITRQEHQRLCDSVGVDVPYAAMF